MQVYCVCPWAAAGQRQCSASMAAHVRYYLTEQQPMLIVRELNYDVAQLQESVVAQTAMLNANQLYIY